MALRATVADRDVAFGDVTEKNVGLMRVLNQALYPVKYADSFYQDILATQDFTQFGANLWQGAPGAGATSCAIHPLRCAAVYLRDLLVGAICSRLEPQEDQTFKLYILTLGVLEPYRRLGLGSRMLTHICNKTSEQPDIKQIYLHVQVGNDAARLFYKAHGFTEGKLVENYYRDVAPAGANVFYKDVNSDAA